MKRFQNDVIYRYTNTDEILNTIHVHSLFAIGEVVKPNQTHAEYVTYDLGCHSDICLHFKQIDFGKIVEFFRNSEHAFGTFATKFVNYELLKYNPKGKIRVRISLIPNDIKIKTQGEVQHPGNFQLILFGNKLKEAGYEVHISFAPIILRNGSFNYYKNLLTMVEEDYEGDRFCECILLTHNKSKHAMNMVNDYEHEDLLWNPNLQVSKQSQYGGENVRYKDKAILIDKFVAVMNKYAPSMKIRYIF